MNSTPTPEQGLPDTDVPPTRRGVGRLKNMPFMSRAAAGALLLIPILAAGQVDVSQRSAPPIAVVSRLEFHSNFWMNLHHVLFAAAWANRPEAGTLRALAGRLPAPLEAPFTESERATWRAAVDYYDREVAARDMLFGRGMVSLKAAIVAGDLSRDAVGPDLRRALESAAPIYRRHFWPAHDRANREWIAAVADRVRKTGPDIIARLEKLYGVPWFSKPVRVDVVWVGNRQGAYTTTDPPHATISSGDAELTEWGSVEIVFHEVSHVLVLSLQKELETALGDRLREHRVLWHVIQFYLTGAAVQQALRARGVDYMPYMYSTGLLDRAWGRYRKPVEANWAPYVEGKVTREAAIAGTIGDLGR
jgi:hypothetical protein